MNNTVLLVVPPVLNDLMAAIQSGHDDRLLECFTLDAQEHGAPTAITALTAALRPSGRSIRAERWNLLRYESVDLMHYITIAGLDQASFEHVTVRLEILIGQSRIASLALSKPTAAQ